MGCVGAKETQCCGQQTLCMCGLDGVTCITAPWYVYPQSNMLFPVQRKTQHKRLLRLCVVIYPISGLVSINGTLWLFRFGCRRLGRHGLKYLMGLSLSLHQSANCLNSLLCIHSGYITDYLIKPVGLWAVRALQRRARRPHKRLAVAMALHTRLGAGSPLQALGVDLIKLLCP